MLRIGKVSIIKFNFDYQEPQIQNMYYHNRIVFKKNFTEYLLMDFQNETLEFLSNNIDTVMKMSGKSERMRKKVGDYIKMWT